MDAFSELLHELTKLPYLVGYTAWYVTGRATGRVKHGFFEEFDKQEICFDEAEEGEDTSDDEGVF
jgi:hypothetical protein